MKTYTVVKVDGTTDTITNATSASEDESGIDFVSDADEVVAHYEPGIVEDWTEHDDPAASAPATPSDANTPAAAAPADPASADVSTPATPAPEATPAPGAAPDTSTAAPADSAGSVAAPAASSEPAAPADPGVLSTAPQEAPGAGQGSNVALNAPLSPAFDPATQGHGYDPNTPIEQSSPDLIPGTPVGDSPVYGSEPLPEATLPDYAAPAAATPDSQPVEPPAPSTGA